MKATHNTLIADWLKLGCTITPLEALNMFGCMRLGARIYDLREQGLAIKSEMVEVETRTGKARVALYSLEKN